MTLSSITDSANRKRFRSDEGAAPEASSQAGTSNQSVPSSKKRALMPGSLASLSGHNAPIVGAQPSDKKGAIFVGADHGNYPMLREEPIHMHQPIRPFAGRTLQSSSGSMLSLASDNVEPSLNDLLNSEKAKILLSDPKHPASLLHKYYTLGQVKPQFNSYQAFKILLDSDRNENDSKITLHDLINIGLLNKDASKGREVSSEHGSCIYKNMAIFLTPKKELISRSNSVLSGGQQISPENGLSESSKSRLLLASSPEELSGSGLSDGNPGVEPEEDYKVISAQQQLMKDFLSIHRDNIKNGFSDVYRDNADGSQDATINKLIECNALEFKDEYGWMPLHYAYSIGCDYIDLLLENGQDINLLNDHGQTASHIAAGNVNELHKQDNNYIPEMEVLDYLLSKGADIHIEDGEEQSVLKLLISQMEVQNSEGKTKLHVAFDNEFWNLAEVFLKEKAEFTAKDSYGKTPLSYAVSRADIYHIDEIESLKLLNLFPKETLSEAAKALTQELKEAFAQKLMQKLEEVAKKQELETPLMIKVESELEEVESPDNLEIKKLIDSTGWDI